MLKFFASHFLKCLYFLINPFTPFNPSLSSPIINSSQSYGAEFVAKVYQKHVLAKTYFSRVAEMVESMRSKVADLPLPRPPEHVITARSPKISAHLPSPTVIQS